MSNEDVKKAQLKLEEFLQQNPHLIKYQEKVQKVLNITNDPSERLKIIQQLMRNKYEELEAVLGSLEYAIANLKKVLDN